MSTIVTVSGTIFAPLGAPSLYSTGVMVAFDLPAGTWINGSIDSAYDCAAGAGLGMAYPPEGVTGVTPIYGLSGSYSDTMPLNAAAMRLINRSAGQTLYLIFGSRSLVTNGNFTLHHVTLHLIDNYAEPAKTHWGQAWSACVEHGRAVIGYIGWDSQLYMATSGALKNAFKQSAVSPIWSIPAVLSPSANDVNACMHVGQGRAQLWWTPVGQLSSKYVHHLESTVYATSSAGGTDGIGSFSAPVPIVGQTNPNVPLLPTQITQPFEPTFVAPPYSGNPGYPARKTGVYSQSQTLFDDPTFSTGTDHRLYGFGCVNADNGLGALWQPVNTNTGMSAANVPGNSAGGAPRANAAPLFPGKTYAQVTALHPASTPIKGASATVRAANGMLYKLLFTSITSRFCPVFPRPGTLTASVGHNLINNTPVTLDSQGAFMDYQDSTATALPLSYRMAVPDGAKIVYVRWNWQWEVFQRPPIKGVLDNPTRPTQLTFKIPTLAHLPVSPVPPPPADPYAVFSAFQSAMVLPRFTFRDATGITLHIGKRFVPANPSAVPPVPASGDPLPGPAHPPVFVGGSLEPIEGRGEWGMQPLPPPNYAKVGPITLSLQRVIDLDRARNTKLAFDIDYLNTSVDPKVVQSIGSMAWKECFLAFQTQAPPYVAGVSMAPTLVLQSAQPGSTVPPQPLGLQGQPLEPEVAAETSYASTPTIGFLTQTPNDALMDELNAQHGSTWDFDAIYTPGIFSDGTAQPAYLPIVDQYAQVGYQVDATNPYICDFFLVRSKDNGASWEFANNAKAITGLKTLKDWNNTQLGGYVGPPALMPSLLVDDNALYVIWIEDRGGIGSPIHTLASQDFGDTWQGG